jgi:hypothetical protein
MPTWGPAGFRLPPSSTASYGYIMGAQAKSWEWVQYNPIVPAAVFAGESDTGRFKIGDGVSDWNTLPYYRIDTLTDIIIDDSSRGLILKDDASPPHYWRVTVNSSGVLQTTDLGTSKPANTL